jgi:hypothetical protein
MGSSVRANTCPVKLEPSARDRIRWRFIDRHPKEAGLLDRPHQVGKIHWFHHLSIDAVFIEMSQIRRFT